MLYAVVQKIRTPFGKIIIQKGLSMHEFVIHKPGLVHWYNKTVKMSQTMTLVQHLNAFTKRGGEATITHR